MACCDKGDGGRVLRAAKRLGVLFSGCESGMWLINRLINPKPLSSHPHSPRLPCSISVRKEPCNHFPSSHTLSPLNQKYPLSPPRPIPPQVCELPQSVRDSVATRLLGLTLKELFEWRFMQTDPNWGNFLYDVENDKINLIDFGASRDYPEVSAIRAKGMEGD